MAYIKFLLSIALLSILISCDPSDSRLSIHNNTSDTIVVRLLFDSELPSNPISQRGKHTIILPDEVKSIGIFNRWDGEFKRALPDTLINLVVVENYDLISNPQLWDSLFYLKKYPLKKVSLRQMEQQNWIIEYP